MHAMKSVEVAGIRMGVVDEGSGPCVLFAHGFPLDHAMWRPQIDALRDSHRVIVPDLRGFGTSDTTPDVVSMERFADDLFELLDALAIGEPITFCGLSMGGYIAWQFWRRHPKRVAALVLCDTRAAPDSPEAAQGRHDTAEKVLRQGRIPLVKAMIPKLFSKETREKNPEMIDDVRAMIGRASPEGIAAALRGMAQREDAREYLDQINLPALLVVGEEDEISPVEEMQSIAAAMPKAEFAVIPNAGHMAPLENPSATNEVLLSFLKSLPQ